ncbi:M20 family metallopeptidase [Stetteria hydrogenophila]
MKATVPDALEQAFPQAEKYAVDVLLKLLAIPTVSPAGEGYEEAAGFLADQLSSLGFKVEVARVPREYAARHCPLASEAPRVIVLGRAWGGSKTLHFNGHYDVVPGGAGWTVTDPFKPVIVDGRIYGRGAVDMKGGIAATVGALKAIADAGLEPPVGVEAAFVPDEEIGGECGTGYLVREMGVRPDYVIIPEPSGLDYAWYGHKGLLWVKVVVEGRPAHASTPWLGSNAFLSASRVALALSEILAAMYSTRRSRHKIVPEEAAYPTFAIGGRAGVPGGGKTNQVPGAFEFTIDRRLIPEESVDEVFKEMEAALRMAAIASNASARLEMLQSMEPAVSRIGVVYETLAAAAEAVRGRRPEPVICPGGLDLRYYTEVGSEVVSYGPDGTLAHAPDEYVSVEELSSLLRILAVATLNMPG